MHRANKAGVGTKHNGTQVMSPREWQGQHSEWSIVELEPKPMLHRGKVLQNWDLAAVFEASLLYLRHV